jgi:acyl dehydratase
MPFAFDANDWPIVPARSFAELKVGEIFRAPSRTLTDAHASAFQAVSCDNHPIHYDMGYANRYGHSAPVVHGLQVLAFTAPGATLLPHNFGAIFIAFTELSARFLIEVHAGDTLYSALEIVSLTPMGDKARSRPRSPYTIRGESWSCPDTTNTCCGPPDSAARPSPPMRSGAAKRLFFLAASIVLSFLLHQLSCRKQ